MSFLKVIVGLGNPGAKYEDTRHNIGFRVVEDLAQQVRWSENKNYYYSEIELAGQPVKIIKPLTFMNRSGYAVAEFVRFYKYQISELLVVHDELDLPFGTIRVKFGGGDAGNNGLRSISEVLGSSEYYRLRIGVDKPADVEREISSWVLSKFSAEEKEKLPDLIARACSAIEELALNGLKSAQNKYNG